jgi:hypothetical protein
MSPDLSSGTVKHHWLYRASTAQVVAVAVGFGVGVWALNAGLDLLWAMYNALTVIPMATVDALVAIVSAVVLLKLMFAQRAYHRKLLAQLETVAEMNHHIRNALEQIEMTAHLSKNEQFINDIQQGVARIQWALREVLPRPAADEEDF